MEEIGGMNKLSCTGIRSYRPGQSTAVVFYKATFNSVHAVPRHILIVR